MINQKHGIWNVFRVYGSIVIVVCCITSCKKSNQLETAPVSGIVTLDGKPIPSGTVIFNPSKGPAAKGTIQNDGSFVMETYGSGDGATIGKHQAIVRSPRPGLTGRKNFEIEESGKELYLHPTRYLSPETSGFQFDVKSGQKNHFKLEMKSK